MLSKFLLLGMPLGEVVARGTINAANVFPAFGDLGTLRAGAPADIAILDMRAGEFEFLDNARTPRRGRSKLSAHASVMAGKLVRRTA